MGWLDVLVGVLLAGFGVALGVVLLLDGGSATEVLLVAVLFGWLCTSFSWETLSDFWKRRTRR